MCNQISDLAGPLGYSGQTSYKFGKYLTVAFTNRFQYEKVQKVTFKTGFIGNSMYIIFLASFK